PYSRTLTFQQLRALGLITVRQIPSLVDGVAMVCQSVWLCRLYDGVGWFNLKNPGSSFLSEITQSCQEVPLNFR
ncbi:MAG: hypothetical protein ACYCT0_07560, partial [Sulfobacillus sp.]